VLVTDGGQADAKVIGYNQGSGQTVGVWGEVDSSDGCGFATPDDVRIDGTVLTNETDFTVEAGTQSTNAAQNVVLGHASNTVAGGTAAVTIAGGGYDSGSNDLSHVAYDDYGTIGGGRNNQVGTSDNSDQSGGTVAGGLSNTASRRATVGGGIGNTASGQDATVGGGNNNTASGEDATVGGGQTNTASGKQATVGGGDDNTASDWTATVAGGYGNTASGGDATVAGGYQNTASGSRAMVPGGQDNEASGDYSFAAGKAVRATETGSFVWNGGGGSYVESPASNTFSVQARNGIWLGTDYSPSIGSNRFIDTSTGAYLSDGGTWTDSCSVTEKERFTPTDSIDVLEKVDSLEVSTWQYTDDDGDARHMGPTAEQFHDTFGLGDDEHHIAPLDTGGVALTAIQGLSTQLDQKDDRINRLQDNLDAKDDRIEEVEAENDELRERLADIEAHLGLDDSEISTDD
jgi:hypothetical protein